MEPKIIHEEKDFLVVEKPAGLLVHPYLAKGELRGGETLTDWLLKKYPELESVGDKPDIRPGIVHRLDKETSGILLIPRTQAAFEYFKSLFAERRIVKKYLAVVHGVPKEKSGTIDMPIGIKNGTVKRSVHAERMRKPAVTEYKVLKTSLDEYSLLEITPRTGRTHQIRVHLAAIGHPIVGDKLYGRKILDSRFQILNSRLMLHALSLEFSTSDGRRLKFETDVPVDFSTGF
jgi:23S rRNA pseudouridine1911/1915/1917 synthase